MKHETWIGYAAALGGTAACTAIGFAMQRRFDLVNIAMVYLLPVVWVALRHTRGAAVCCALASVLAFDVLFVPPQGTITVDDAQYLLTFAILVAVAVVVSGLVERARRQARAQAQAEVEAERERIRSVLLASISHDLRTPLAVMAGASSTLAEQGDSMRPEERRELARSVLHRTREMAEHVAKVLDMTRLEAGGLEPERDWSSIGEIAGSVVRRLEERLRHHRVMLEIPDDLPLVRVDAVLLDKALGNLLENAAHHTPAGTVVRVRAGTDGAEMTVSVEDYGGGISEAELGRVFDKFHRGRAEGVEGGMGLGLAICRSVVRLHGGRAWAERVPAGGTAFRFTIPLEGAPPPVPAESP